MRSVAEVLHRKAEILRQPVKRGEWRRWKRILLPVYCVVAVASLHSYIEWRSAAFVVGILVLVLTPVFENHPSGSFRYGWVALAFLLLYIFLPVRTVLYLALAAAVLLFRESWYRRAEPTIPLVILLLSPITDYAVQLFSFPIRLRLTVMAAGIIRAAGLPVVAAGNILTCKGREFAVDPACMGLHMLVVSLLAGVLLINYQQGRYRRRLGMGVILLLLGLVAGLNVLANLFRIVCLVLFAILPDNPIHGMMGIICLVAYVILPMFPITRVLVRCWGRPVAPEGEATGRKIRPVSGWRRSRLLLVGNWLVGACLMVAVGVSLVRDGRHSAPDQGIPSVPGYVVSRMEGDILQLNNGRSLVYIKPVPDFYYTDHSPILCWQGSGYVFGQLQERLVGGVRIYQGVLVREGQVLYTAWWYDNGRRRTTEQLDWRWDVLRGGRKYSIVNITAANRDVLESEVRRVLSTNPFSRVLGGII